MPQSGPLKTISINNISLGLTYLVSLSSSIGGVFGKVSVVDSGLVNIPTLKTGGLSPIASLPSVDKMKHARKSYWKNTTYNGFANHV